MTLLQDIRRIFGAKTSDIVSHNNEILWRKIIGYSQILYPGCPRGPYLGNAVPLDL
jgi:hypothetical protein